MRSLLAFILVIWLSHADGAELRAEAPQFDSKPPVIVGIATVLSGDLSVLGQNIRRTVETYQRHFLRHHIQFVFEDAGKGGAEGLRAYQRLINVERVDMLLGGTTSNGTLAAASLINRSQTPLITPLTGGQNVDLAGDYVFRIGNSDILNGIEQAQVLVSRGIVRVALITENTEYTNDIANAFRKEVQRSGVLQVVLDREFLPSATDFRADIGLIRAARPEAIVVLTQTGLAFGLFLRQLHELSPDRKPEVHTNFVAAANPDARTAAGDLLDGVFFLAPQYNRAHPRLCAFFRAFEVDHGTQPAIPFHTAGTVDALDLLQRYLDRSQAFDRVAFQSFLSQRVRDYDGLMGQFSFDARGNSNLGFEVEEIGAASALTRCSLP